MIDELAARRARMLGCLIGLRMYGEPEAVVSVADFAGAMWEGAGCVFELTGEEAWDLSRATDSLTGDVMFELSRIKRQMRGK